MTKALEIAPLVGPRTLITLSKRSDGELREDPKLVEPEADRYKRLEAMGRALAMFPSAVERIRDIEARNLALKYRVEVLEAVLVSAGSVLSEDGVREYLAAYVMGVELISRVDAARSS